MFTGLIESVGRVADVAPSADGFRLRVATPVAGELHLGESVAFNGVCLTIVQTADGKADVEISPETARVTTLGRLRTGSLVNLERAMRADARIGGHFVQGHVDATGTVGEVRPEGDCRRVRIAFPMELAPFLVRKGSVAVDGISLTIADLRDESFDVQIIPYTWEHTNVHAIGAGDAVNLECDILGKYVVRFTELAGLRVSGPTGSIAFHPERCEKP